MDYVGTGYNKADTSGILEPRMVHNMELLLVYRYIDKYKPILGSHLLWNT